MLEKGRYGQARTASAAVISVAGPLAGKGALRLHAEQILLVLLASQGLLLEKGRYDILCMGSSGKFLMSQGLLLDKGRYDTFWPERRAAARTSQGLLLDKGRYDRLAMLISLV
ncbi:MAG: hypothetical protein Q4F72_05690 [Desulfovibrionaceae bacterium]|nr:hypothetical protein [Desulfovibrionaceae bacterium]